MSGIVYMNHTNWNKATVINFKSSRSIQHLLTKLQIKQLFKFQNTSFHKKKNLLESVLVEYRGTFVRGCAKLCHFKKIRLLKSFFKVKLRPYFKYYNQNNFTIKKSLSYCSKKYLFISKCSTFKRTIATFLN